MADDVLEPGYSESGASRSERLKRVWRLVAVLTRMDIKLRYGDSALGYVWTIGKPLALFTILYIVFGRLVRFSTTPPHYALYLVIGVMLWSFFADGVTRIMSSIVANGMLLRKLPFPRIVIPLATSLTAFITFGLSVLTIAIFVGINGLVPQWSWSVLILELLELYLLVLGLGLLLSVIYVRLRDIAQVLELALQLFFFLSPIVYPFEIIPETWRKIMLVNPFTQIMQDFRAIVIYSDNDVIVAPAALSPLRLLPLLIVGLVLALAIYLFKREEPWLPERV